MQNGIRVGLIARSDRTGLGNQTRNLARMLRPDEVMLINSKSFNGNEQHPEMYAQYSVMEINGFPTETQIREWLKGLDVVITCEIFYHLRFVEIAREMGVKTINQFNWEFADYLRHPEMAIPDVLVSPSKWHIEEANAMWKNVIYLPTPVFTDDFEAVKEENYKRNGKKRFLHIMGRQAANDRNGTMDLLRALQWCREDFDMVIKAQSGDLAWLRDYLDTHYSPNTIIDVSSPENEVDLYRDFDALVLPRRYGGQCLPMTEALCAGLPVIMTNVSPNDELLPPFWLLHAESAGRFMARTWIDMYTVNHAQLGERLDFFSKKDLHGDKIMAYNIGYREFSNHELETKWEKLIEDTCSR